MEVKINDLQAYLLEHYKDRRHETALFMKLVEEIGEVAEVLNKRAGRKHSENEDLDKELVVELADMIHYIVGIAAINNLNLNDVIIEKDKKASIKYNHSRNLEQFINQKNELE